MHGRLLGLALVLSFSAMACGGGGGDEPSSDAPAAVVAAPPADAPAPAQPPPAISSPDPGPTTTPDPGPTAPACGASTLCLDVSSLRQGMTPHAGRLVVVWMSLSGGAPEIGYDAPFAGTEPQVSIPLTSVTPPSDANAFCEHAGTGQCTGAVKIGFGVVGVLDDAGAGKADLAQLALGLSDANVLYSQTALKPPPKGWSWAGVPMEQAFPSGVEQGANAYVAPKGNFQELIPAQSGATFKLQVCDTDNPNQCSVHAPFSK